MTREHVTQHVPQSDRDKATLRNGDQAENQSVTQRKKNKLAAASAGSRAALGPRGPRPAAVLHLGWGAGENGGGKMETTVLEQ